MKKYQTISNKKQVPNKAATNWIPNVRKGGHKLQLIRSGRCNNDAACESSINQEIHIYKCLDGAKAYENSKIKSHLPT